MTDQSFKDSCDVNNIIAKYIQTGIDPVPGKKEQNFGFASAKTYTESAQAMAEINSAFAELPSDERTAHSNDPAAWLDSLIAPAGDPTPSETPDVPSGASDTPSAEPAPQDATPAE